MFKLLKIPHTSGTGNRLYTLSSSVRYLYGNWSTFRRFPTLETSRLVLREAELRDVPYVLRNHSDNSVMRFLGTKKLTSMVEAEDLIKDAKDSFVQKEGIRWVITLKDEDSYIGSIGFWRLDGKGEAEVGYELAPPYWGKGIMKEALRSVIEFGFEKLKLHTIMANVAPDNKRSSKLLEKLGFNYEGDSHGPFGEGGAHIKTILYTMDRSGAEED